MPPPRVAVLPAATPPAQRVSIFGGLETCPRPPEIEEDELNSIEASSWSFFGLLGPPGWRDSATSKLQPTSISEKAPQSIPGTVLYEGWQAAKLQGATCIAANVFVNSPNVGA